MSGSKEPATGSLSETRESRAVVSQLGKVFTIKDMTFPKTLIGDAVVRSIRGFGLCKIGVNSLNEHTPTKRNKSEL